MVSTSPHPAKTPVSMAKALSLGRNFPQYCCAVRFITRSALPNPLYSSVAVDGIATSKSAPDFIFRGQHVRCFWDDRWYDEKEIIIWLTRQNGMIETTINIASRWKICPHNIFTLTNVSLVQRPLSKLCCVCTVSATCRHQNLRHCLGGKISPCRH